MSIVSARLCSVLRQSNILRWQAHCLACRPMCTSPHQGDGEEYGIQSQHQGRQPDQSFTPRQRRGHKLHNRRLTEEEQEHDKKQNDMILNLSESDTFGSLGRSVDRNITQSKPYKFGRPEESEDEKITEPYTFGRQAKPDERSESHIRRRSGGQFKVPFPPKQNVDRERDYSGRHQYQDDRSNQSDDHFKVPWSPKLKVDGERRQYGSKRPDLSDDHFKVSSFPKPNLDRQRRHGESWQYRNDGDMFGTLGEAEKEIGLESVSTEIGSHNERFADDDDGDTPHHIRLKTFDKRDIEWYGCKIEKFGKQGKIKEAIAVLEEWMLKKDRVKPSQYIFTALIGVVSRVGYSKKAFQLFNQMKKMGLQPEDPTYTALFNACANSPWKSDGLTRANNLRSLMQIKGYEPNLVTYHAIIKAYGILGDIQTAFVLMDELTKRFRPTAETFSFLLMACISDKKAGFKHAVEVWRQLQLYGVTPEMHQYNLLLRTVRDCGAGDADFANQLLVGQNQDRLSDSAASPDKSSLAIEEPSISDTATSTEYLVQGSIIPVTSSGRNDQNDVQCVSTHEWWEDVEDIQGQNLPSQVDQSLTSSLPNLLDPKCDLSQVISMGQLDKPEERLAVIGGVAGILEAMAVNGAHPDVRTFSQLVEVAPSSVEAEMALLAKMETLGVKPDIIFFNTIMRRRCFRWESDAARDVLQQISAARLRPDMKTFGCLAMTCKNKHDGIQLLKDMEQVGVSPNIEVLGTLACTGQLDFGYKLVILEHVDNLDLRPNDKFIDVVEASIAKAKWKIVQVERGQIVDRYISSDYFTSTFAKFMTYYTAWLHRSRPQEKVHPWEDFRKKKNEQAEAKN